MENSLLRGMVLQILNIAKVEFLKPHPMGFMMWVMYQPDSPLKRMLKLEKLIEERAGKEWLNDASVKHMVFSHLRVMFSATGFPTAIATVTYANRFTPTDKMLALPPEEQMAILKSGHKTQHQKVAEGLMQRDDVIWANVQTVDTICMATQVVDEKRRRLVGEPDILTAPIATMAGSGLVFYPTNRTESDIVEEYVRAKKPPTK